MFHTFLLLCVFLDLLFFNILQRLGGVVLNVTNYVLGMWLQSDEDNFLTI
jgi:hypothetical protein